MPVGAVPFPFGKCRICKDKATGVHYGVATCEGCKGFFKRSITKAEKYKCFFGGECEVTPKNRNRCKSCRFRICLENGMSVEAVRMGRIPKIEKEKALEAVVSDEDRAGQEGLFTPLPENVNNYPRYNEPAPTSYNNPTGPEIYDFDTGCISRQSRTIADDNGNQLSDMVASSALQGQRSVGESVSSMMQQQQISGAHGSNPVKSEFDSMEASSCHYSHSGNKGSAMEIYKCSKDTNNREFERKHNTCTTYQYSDFSSMGINDSYERNSSYNGAEQLQRHETLSMNDSHSSNAQSRNEANIYTQGHKHYRPHNQKLPDIKSQRNPNSDFLLLNSSPSFTNRSHLYHNEPFFHNQGQEIQRAGEGHTVATDVTLSSHCGNSYNDKKHVNQSFEQEERAMEIPTLKTEPVDMEVSESFCDPRQGKPTSVNVPQLHTDSNFPDNDHNQSRAFSISHEADDRKIPLQVEFSRLSSGRSASIMSFPPTCPTPTSIDGSTSSSQRGRFSPGLIKILLEQVLDSTQDHDVAVRLKQKLEQNKMDKQVVTNVLYLIREVSAKRNKQRGSDGTSLLSSVENSATSEPSSALTESKMENIQRFLEDVSKFSNQQSLPSPSYSHRANISHSTSKVDERQNCPSDNVPGSYQPSQEHFDLENRSQLIHSEKEINKSVEGELGQQKLDSSPVNICQRETENRTSLQDNQPNRNFPLPDLTLTQCEQSRKIGSTQSEDIQNSTERPCDLIDRSINENEVSCSDDKLSKEDVKKQVIQMTLEGLSVASKILYRLKPEHREKLRLLKHGMLKIRVMTDSDEDVKECYKKIIAGIPHLNELILGFCEHVPGFSSINAQDRGILMKRAYYDIWMLTSAEYFFDNEVNIFLHSGEIYAKRPMEKILNKEIVDTLMDFANQFNELHLNDLEISMLCAIRLTCSDDLDIKERSTVKKLHSLLLDVFAMEIEQNHPDTHTRLLIDIFRLMPLLAVTNKMQCQIIAKYRLDKPEQVEDEGNTEST